MADATRAELTVTNLRLFEVAEELHSLRDVRFLSSTTRRHSPDFRSRSARNRSGSIPSRNAGHFDLDGPTEGPLFLSVTEARTCRFNRSINPAQWPERRWECDFTTIESSQSGHSRDRRLPEPCPVLLAPDTWQLL
jgi:hypothetical protein